ncbi:MAG: M20/M25/M40 family metallo-hydrolase [Oscillospiraceae bacterium]
MKDTQKQLLEFCSITGVPGLEQNAVHYAANILKEYGDTRISSLGSLICTVQKPVVGKPHIMLDAHIDEIGMIVTYINEKGFLKVASCGGVDRRLLLSSQVTVHTQEKDLVGIICSIPPHLQTDTSKNNPKIEDIYIDIGFDQETAQKLVRIGDRITINDTPMVLLNDYICSAAIDDRAGCVAIMLAVKQLKKENLVGGLSVVFSTMEEVGGMGAKTAAYELNPTHAIAVDVGFGDMPDVEEFKSCKVNSGPAIAHAPILCKQMSKKLEEVAKAKNIPFQLEAMGGRTGTNADGIATSRCGVKTAILSIPQRYMHTTVEVVATQDVENTAKLIAEYVKEVLK